MKRASLRIALDEVLQHPVRTFLIAQGMLWAVAVTIIPAAVIQGSRAQAVERARELGTDRIEVSFDRSLGPDAVPVETDLETVRERLLAREWARNIVLSSTNKPVTANRPKPKKQVRAW